MLFLIYGLDAKNYTLIKVFYGIRSFAYLLFLYSFIVMIVQNVKGSQISPSMGWFWRLIHWVSAYSAAKSRVLFLKKNSPTKWMYYGWRWASARPAA
ncbi:hypothetical protein EGS38_07550 [Neisseria chenwenguii]|nr:hypothetical protein EGS38_07550 [Neisseria chenwenguii]